jgi:hypothetical protein
MNRLMRIIEEQDSEEVGFTEYVETTFGEFGDVETDLDDEAGTGTFSVEGEGWRAEIVVDKPEHATVVIQDAESEEEIDGDEFEEDDLGSLLDAVYEFIEDGLEDDEDGEETEGKERVA